MFDWFWRLYSGLYRFYRWLKNLRHKKDLEEALQQELERSSEGRRIYVPKPGHQATRQDIGKFMKHGRQSASYRASVKRRIQPDEEHD